MSNSSPSFFDGKREWSEIKDRVLSHYIAAYLKKVRLLKRPILLVDAFASPGVFEDGKPGSPILMCQVAEKYAANNWKAIFVNKKEDHHRKLQNNLAKYIKDNKVKLIKSDAAELLKNIQTEITNHTLFIYLDPFGIKGCDFDILIPLLSRVKKGFSTELLINLSMPTIHREGARNVVLEKGINNITGQTLAKIKNVDKILGGDYWRVIEWNTDLDPEEREKKIVQRYQDKLRVYMKYVMSCPVRETESSTVKYYITFCSRHIDALVLMNDTMGKAYNEYMHEKASEELPLFANSTEDFYQWERGREKAIRELEKIVLSYIPKFNPRLSRKIIWEKNVVDYFMHFLEKEYRNVIMKLVNSEKIIPINLNFPKRINDNTVFNLKE